MARVRRGRPARWIDEIDSEAAAGRRWRRVAARRVLGIGEAGRAESSGGPSDPALEFRRRAASSITPCLLPYVFFAGVFSAFLPT